LWRSCKDQKKQQKLYPNLIRFTLSMAPSGTDRLRLRALRKKVQATPNVADLAWLEGRIAEVLG
jgi:hypothetical protein